MNSSFLYHAWGLYSFECTREEYKGNTIQLFFMCKAKASKDLSQVRKVQFGQERIPYKGFPWLPYRRQENHHTYESATLQVQMRWLRLRPAGEHPICDRLLFLHPPFRKTCGGLIAIHDLERRCGKAGYKLGHGKRYTFTLS